MLEIVYATKRLHARRWNAVMDAEAALAIYGDPEVVRHLPPLQPLKNVDEAISFMEKRLATFAEMENGSDFWAVELQEDKEVVGTVTLRYLPDPVGNWTSDLEVGWHFRREAWGNGYATEAASGAISYAFRELGAREVNAIMLPENTRSKRVAERLGMQALGITSEYHGMDHLLYRMHAEDWGSLR